MLNVGQLQYRAARMAFRLNVGGRLRLWRKLSKLLGNGVSLIAALSEIRDRAIDSFGDGNSTVVAISEWIDGLSNGALLDQVVQDWVSLEETLLITAGSNNGDLAGAFASVELVMTSKKRIAKAVRSGLATPLMFCAAIIGFLFYVSFKVVPNFEIMLQGRSWSGAAAVTVEVAALTRQWALLIVAAIVAAVVVAVRALPHWDGPLRIRLDRYPPFSLYCLITGSAWVISLSALIRGGVRTEQALEQILDNSSPWLAARTEDCILGLRSGLSLGEALLQSGKGFPDQETIDDMLIYSKYADFDEALHILGKDLIDDTEAKVELQAAMLKGVSIAAAGTVMLLLYGGILAMQQQMTAAFSGG